MLGDVYFKHCYRDDVTINKNVIYTIMLIIYATITKVIFSLIYIRCWNTDLSKTSYLFLQLFVQMTRIARTCQIIGQTVMKQEQIMLIAVRTFILILELQKKSRKNLTDKISYAYSIIIFFHCFAILVSSCTQNSDCPEFNFCISGVCGK